MSRHWALLLSLSCLWQGCFELRVKSQGKALPLAGTAKVAKASQVTEDKVVAEFKADATYAQVVEAPKSGALKGALAVLQPGALQISTELVIEEAVSLQKTSLVSELGLSNKVELSSASAGLIVRPSTDVLLTQPMTIRMSLPSSLSFWLFGSNHYVVFYKQFTKDGLVSGLIPSDKVRIISDFSTGPSVEFDGYFGAYWVVKVEEPILEEKVVASEEPIVNSNNVAVIEDKGIVSEEKILEKESLPEVVWSSISLSFDEASRTLILRGSLADSNTLASCRVDIGESEKDLNTTTLETDTTLNSQIAWSEANERPAIARYRCLDSQGRTTISSWSNILTIPAKAETSTTPTSDTQAPTAPTSIALSLSSPGNVSIAWNAATDDQSSALSYGYNLCTNTCDDTSSCSTEQKTTALTASIATSVAGTFYACVRAYDTAGNISSWTRSTTALDTGASIGTDSTAPILSNPSLTALSQADGKIQLTWTPASDNLTPAASLNYTVYMQIGLCPSQAIQMYPSPIASSNSTSFTMLLPVNTSYCFTVKVSDLSNNSTYYNLTPILHATPTLNAATETGWLGSSNQRKVFYDSDTQTHLALFATKQSNSQQIRLMRSSDGLTWSLSQSLSISDLKDFSASLGKVGTTSYLYLIYSTTAGSIYGQRAQISSPASVGSFSTSTVLWAGSITTPYENPSLTLTRGANPSLIVACSQRAGYDYAVQYRSFSPTFANPSNIQSLTSTPIVPSQLSLVADEGGGAYLLANSHQMKTFYISSAGTFTAVPAAESTWEGFFSRTIRGTVTSVVQKSDGSLIVGGKFTLLDNNGRLAQNIVSWTNNQWSALGEGSPSPVRQILLDSQGKIYIRGFDTYNSGSSYVRSWNGSNWDELPLPLTLDIPNTPAYSAIPGFVTSFHFSSTGELWLGGAFTGIKTPSGLLSANGIVSWSPSTGVFTPRSLPSPSGNPLLVQSMAQTPNQTYVTAMEASDFYYFLNYQRSFMVCPYCSGIKPTTAASFWSYSGSNWSSLNSPSANLTAVAQIVSVGSDLYSMGYSPTMIKPSQDLPNQYEVHLARVDRLRNGSWQNLTTANPCTDENEGGTIVHRYCQQGNFIAAGALDNELYVSLIPTASFVSSSTLWPELGTRVLRFNSSTNIWDIYTIPKGGPILTAIRATFGANSSVVMGGSFEQLQDKPVPSLALFSNTNGTTTVNAISGPYGDGPNGVVRQFSVGPLAVGSSSQQVLLAGQFTQVGALSSPYIASFSNGTFSPLPGLTQEPLAIKVNSSGQIYAGIANANGFDIQRWDGSGWTTVTSALGFLRAMDLAESGKIFVIGASLRQNTDSSAQGYPAMVYDPSVAGGQWNYLGSTNTSARLLSVSPDGQLAFATENSQTLYHCTLQTMWSCVTIPSILSSGETVQFQSLLWDGAGTKLMGTGVRFTANGSYNDEVLATWVPSAGNPWSLLASSQSYGSGIGRSARLVTGTNNSGFTVFSLNPNDPCSMGSPNSLMSELYYWYDTCRMAIDAFDNNGSLISRQERALPPISSLIPTQEADRFGGSAVLAVAMLNNEPIIGGEFKEIQGFPGSYVARVTSTGAWNGFHQGISALYNPSSQSLMLLGARKYGARLSSLTSAGSTQIPLPSGAFLYGNGARQFNISLSLENSTPFLNLLYLDNEYLMRKKFNPATGIFETTGASDLVAFGVDEIAAPDSSYQVAGESYATILYRTAGDKSVRWLRLLP